MGTAEQRAPLSREAIVESAIEFADAEGVDALSMRKLARQLGYEVMSLYNHVANKGELLAAMADTIALEIDGDAAGLTPLQSVRAIAVSTRDAFIRHPWAPDLWLRQVPGAARTDVMERLLERFAASGLSDETAHLGFHAVNNHVVGYTLQELAMALGSPSELRDDPRIRNYLAGLSADTNPHVWAHVQQHLAGESGSSFEVVLDLILDGLVRLDGAPGTGSTFG